MFRLFPYQQEIAALQKTTEGTAESARSCARTARTYQWCPGSPKQQNEGRKRRRQMTKTTFSRASIRL
jgi:hypothetical protein